MKQNLLTRVQAAFLAVAVMLSMTVPAFAEESQTVTIEKMPETLALEIEETEDLAAEVHLDGKITNTATSKLKYSSDNETVATVDLITGLVTAVTEGQANITVTYKTLSATCKVTVTAPTVDVTGVTINSIYNKPLNIGDTLALTATVSPSNATDKTVTWKSSNSAVASISSSGDVKALSPGTTIITAAGGNDKSAQLEITVSGLVMDKTLNLLVGKSVDLICTPFGDAKLSTLTWSSSNISVAGVKDGKVSAYNPGTTTITAKAGSYSASCSVTVKEDVADAVTGSMTVGETYSFSTLMSTLNSRAYEKIQTGLEYVTGLSVSPNAGILFHGYSSPDVPGSGVGGSELYYVNGPAGQRKLSDVTFVPAADFDGTAVISYTGFGSGRSFNGSIRITVSNSGDVAYNTAEDRPLQLEIEDFNLVCNKKTGRSLRYVTFQLPSASKGTLYYNYSTTGQFSPRVTEDTNYYLSGGSTLLSEVTFVPAKGYTGTVTIPYYGVDTSGGAYSGKITVMVYALSQTGADQITYQVTDSTSVSFDADDFNRVCMDNTGATLNYVYFDLPDPEQGTLYYNYRLSSAYNSQVSSGTRYFRTSTPKISLVYFVPASGFSGTVTIPYTGYASTGEQFQGEVVIRANGGSGTVRYSTNAGKVVDFVGMDFNEACQNGAGAALSYVQFDLPSSNQGTLYYRYVSSSNKGTQVTESRQYTASQIDSITFVPKGTYQGTVTIPFSGYAVGGGRFDGRVEIVVDPYDWDDTISYTVYAGGRAMFNSENFNSVCKYHTGENLDYVRFTLPSSKQGVLYYDYDSNKGTGTAVTERTSYYRSGRSRLLEDVYFAASSGFKGTVSISYTGVSVGGEHFDGIVQISVAERVNTTVTYYGSALPIDLNAADFRSANASALPKTLSYIQFNALPDAIYGKLLVNAVRAGTGTPVTINDRFYMTGTPAIGSVSFVAKPAFQGTVTIPYTAVDTSGTSTEGTIRIQVANSYLNKHFNDIARYDWAAPSIEFLFDSGVISGYGDGRYGPADTTTRGAFAYMICKVFNFEPRTGAGFRDVTEGSMFASEILTAKELGIVSGYNGYFNPNDPVTREQAVVMLKKAMEVAGRTVSSGSPALLDAYGDGAKVSSYARTAMATMVRMGMLSGDEKGNLNPQKPIRRAEIAVILHKVMTM